MARILITGGSSYLGRHLVPVVSAVHDTNYTYFHNDPLASSAGHKLDIRDQTAVFELVAALKPNVIIHTVGSNRAADMSAVITEGTRHITDAAESQGARLIHISTDVVFNGQEAPYDEYAVLSPIHEYGRAKAEAEEIVRLHSNQVIIRTSLIYGLQHIDRGTAWMVKALRSGQPVMLFTNQRRNPVWVETLCQACLELATHEYQGILNVAGKQELTRAEFGLRMLDWWQVEERDLLTFGTADENRWPADCTLDLQLATQILSTPMSGVDEVLRKAGLDGV